MKISDKYQKKFRFIYITFGLLLIATFSYGTENMDVTVDEIYFNHEGGYANDALTISDDGTPIVNVPEWSDSYYPQKDKYRFAYIMGQTTRSIKVRLNAGSYTGLMHLLIKVSYITGTGTDGIGEVCNLFVPNFNANSLLTLYPTGNFPASVGAHEFHWHWEIYAIPINNSNYCAARGTTDTSHHFYTLLAAPQAPMVQPWERVLDYACDWAGGQSTEPTIITSLTTNLYNSGAKYDGNNHHTIGSKSNLYLTYLLNDLDAAPTNTYMDCRDFANFLHVLSNALGLNGCYHVIYHNNSSCDNVTFQFYYNYLFPAGQSPTRGYWNFHQVGWYNNSNVADASTQIDNDDNPTASPYSWKLSVGDMTISGYFDKLSEDSLKSCSIGTCTVY
jgi:hypothetical protein